MATDVGGLTAPGDDESRQPAADIRALRASLHKKVIYPAVNATVQDELVAAFPPSANAPIVVYRVDLDVFQYSLNGTTWTRLAGGSGRHKLTPAGWTSDLWIDREVTARGWKYTLFGQLVRTGGAIQPLTNGWFPITPVTLPTDYKPSNGFDIIAGGSIPGGDCDLLIGVTTNTMALRQPNAPASTGISNGDYLRFTGATWYRDL